MTVLRQEQARGYDPKCSSKQVSMPVAHRRLSSSARAQLPQRAAASATRRATSRASWTAAASKTAAASPRGTGTPLLPRPRGGRARAFVGGLYAAAWGSCCACPGLRLTGLYRRAARGRTASRSGRAGLRRELRPRAAPGAEPGIAPWAAPQKGVRAAAPAHGLLLRTLLRLAGLLRLGLLRRGLRRGLGRLLPHVCPLAVTIPSSCPCQVTTGEGQCQRQGQD